MKKSNTFRHTNKKISFHFSADPLLKPTQTFPQMKQDICVLFFTVSLASLIYFCPDLYKLIHISQVSIG